ncbi:MAG: glycosyltransferase family 2 protein [Cyanobacteria bacterium J06641_5]
MTVNYYSTELIDALVRSLPAKADRAYHLIVVNNSPEDRKLRKLASDTVTILESLVNLGFGKGCNLGLEWIYARDPDAIIWLINPDARLFPDCSLADLDRFFQQYPHLAILGTAIYTEDGGEPWFLKGTFCSRTGAISTQIEGKDLETPFMFCDWVSGCSVILNCSCFTRCPEFDAAFFLYYEDFDFCQRYRLAGHTIAVTHQFAALHAPSSISSRNLFAKFNHSTFSYLLALERYASRTARLWRFLRVLGVAVSLLPIKPRIAFGKMYGVVRYLLSLKT